MTITTSQRDPVWVLANLLSQNREDISENTDIYFKAAEMLLDPLFCPEFVIGIMEVVRAGAAKYDPNGWLNPSGVSTSKKEQHASLSRHLAKAYAGNPIDDESGLYHHQHIATRSMMAYTRISRNITNPKDGE